MDRIESMLFTIWVSSSCNLSCVYCYEGENKKDCNMSKESANDTLDFIINKMVASGAKSMRIVFHGGEPLMNKPIIKYIIDQAKLFLGNYEVAYSITTNGTLIDKTTADFLINHIDDITVSLDGVKEYHDKNRLYKNGRGSFEDALSNALLINTRKPVRIRMTVTPNNVCNLFNNIVFLAECGFRTIIPAIDYFDEKWNDNLLKCLQQELYAIKKVVKENRFNGLFVSMIDKVELKKLGACRGGQDSFHIAPNGDLYPCVYTVGNEKYKCGTVEEGIDSIKLKEFDSINLKTVADCEGCTYYDGCISTRCKFINECLTGDYYKPSPLVCCEQHICLSLYYS